MFAAASPKQPAALYAKGLVDKPVEFATNTLVLIVPKGNPAHITSVNDITKPGVKLVICNATVPCGDYARTAFKNLGITTAAMKNVVSQTTDVTQTVADVATGQADAGFVYITDAKAANGKVDGREPSGRRRSRRPRTSSPWSSRARTSRRRTRSCRRCSPRRARRRFRQPASASREHRRSPRHTDRRQRRPGVGPSARARRRGCRATVVIAVVMAFLMLPIVALFTYQPVHELVNGFGAKVATDAIIVSMKTNVIAFVLMIGFGTPFAYILARRRFRGRSVVITLVEVPLVMPPAVAGLALLVAFGRLGLLGHTLSVLGIDLAFTQAAVVIAILFVASPFYLRGAIAAFEAVDQTLLDVAGTLGAGPVRRMLRVASRSPAAGSVPPRRSRSPAGSASSARRSCSRAASRAPPRRCRSRCTPCSTPTSIRRSRSACCS